jgi:FkbM family methyltransferase
MRVDGRLIRFFINDRTDVVQRYQCRGDFYERECLEELRKYCCLTRTFADVGANVGNHSIFVSKFCDVKDIVVFEPNPRAIALLKINLALNSCDNVDLSYLGVALGSGEGSFRLFQPHADNLGGTQLIEAERGRVRSIRGDDVLLSRPVDVLKIDVEGMEFEVLSGLSQTINRWRPVIFIEVWAQARPNLVGWCDGQGYVLAKEFAYDNYLLLPVELAQ